MTELTLLTKAHNSTQLKQIDKWLRTSFEGLDVEAKVTPAAVNSWIHVSLLGDDEAFAVNYLRREVDFCPVSLTNVQKFSNLKGYIANLGKSPLALQVDVGVFQPETIHAIVPLRHLQATLGDGRMIAMKKIDELFGFCENLPMDVRITVVEKNEKRMEAELATKQVERFRAWRDSMLDRLIVVGSTLHEIKRMLNQTGLDRDIIGIANLGMFENALICKLGTDAAGLMSKVGRVLRDARFTVFVPRKIGEILDYK